MNLVESVTDLTVTFITVSAAENTTLCLVIQLQLELDQNIQQSPTEN